MTVRCITVAPISANGMDLSAQEWHDAVFILYDPDQPATYEVNDNDHVDETIDNDWDQNNEETRSNENIEVISKVKDD